jgi:ABC-2 type transport system ATP-binding protein
VLAPPLSETPTLAPPAVPAVRLEKVGKRFGPVTALDGLDLHVPSGGVYGFLGRNGAGKSTALRIIMGITLPSSGQVQVFGEPLVGDQPRVRQRIGYVAQEQSFYGWMTPARLGRFVAGFYPRWDDGEYQRLLRLLEVPPDRRIQGFSGGTHAKLALCLALSHRPDLLVLDEPTAGMDAVARREFLELVRQQSLRDGRTTIFSSHLIDEVELAADEVGIIDHGRLLFEGPKEALRESTRELRRQGPDATTTPLPAALSATGGPPALVILDDRLDGDTRRVMVRAADPAALAALHQAPDDWQVLIPSLEDTFVAMVRSKLSY